MAIAHTVRILTLSARALLGYLTEWQEYITKPPFSPRQRGNFLCSTVLCLAPSVSPSPFNKAFHPHSLTAQRAARQTERERERGEKEEEVDDKLFFFQTIH